jgi:hypothetical protein
MSVVAIPSALVTRAASRQLHQRLLVLAISSRHNNPITQPQVCLRSALQPIQHSVTFKHSRTPRLRPRPQAFPCAATEAAKSRLFEVVAQLVHRAQRADNSAPTSPLRTGVPEWANSPIPPAVARPAPPPGGDTWAYYGRLPGRAGLSTGDASARPTPTSRSGAGTADWSRTRSPPVPRAGQRATMLPGGHTGKDGAVCRWRPGL